LRGSFKEKEKGREEGLRVRVIFVLVFIFTVPFCWLLVNDKETVVRLIGYKFVIAMKSMKRK